MGDFDWNENNVERLKAMRAEGLPFSDIGRSLGCGRNAAIGKANRLGLTKAAPRTKVNPKRKPKQRGGNTNAFIAIKRQVAAPLELEIFKDPVTFAELAPHHCRFPTGEGASLFFCGADRFQDRPYCPHHCGKAYDLDRTRRSGEHNKQELAKMQRAIAERAA